MFEKILKVTYISSRTSFCYLSLPNYRRLQGTSVSLTTGHTKKKYFFTAVLENHLELNDDAIGINSLYAKCLELANSDVVCLCEIFTLPSISSVTIIADTKDDYIILQSLSGNVENKLLDQLGAIDEDQQIIVWLGSALYAKGRIGEVRPRAPGILVNFTEVTIEPPSSRSANQSLKTCVPTSKNIFLEFNGKQQSFFRIVPLPEQLSSAPFDVFVSRAAFPDHCNENQINIFYLVLQKEPYHTCYVNLCSLEAYFPNADLVNCTVADNIFIGKELWHHLECFLGVRVKLEPHLGTIFENLDSIELCTKVDAYEPLSQLLKQKLFECAASSRSGCVLVSSNVRILDQGTALIRFPSTEIKFSIYNHVGLRKLNINFFNQPVAKWDTKSTFSASKNHIDVGNFGQIIKECKCLIVSKTGDVCRLENVIIEGKPGSGKTHVVGLLSEYFSQYPFYFHCKIIDCKRIKGKSMDTLKTFLSEQFWDAIHRQPSIIFFEDFELICGAASQFEQESQSFIQKNICEMIRWLLLKYGDLNMISVVATTTSVVNIDRIVYAGKGEHLFKNFLTIDPINQVDRKLLLRHYLNNNNNFDLEMLSSKTHSFTVSDIVHLARRCLLEYSINKLEADVRALKYTSVAWWSNPQFEAYKQSFTQIGGLEYAKRVMIETIQWPLKYPELFKHAPLRLPTGMLLYGAPGTGKTLLAHAAANEFGIRIITVKGPELLSKYIGASEQGVRDAFERAQNAKPCILFFDEFDSLAPRRGQDNTGVTDRVVNQLLTQMDGVEVLRDVWVIVATCRPDLIDPAVLRPGRIDRKIFFSLPDEQERHDILRTLISNSDLIELEDDVNLVEISDIAHGFTAADLKSALCTIQFEYLDTLSSDNDTERVKVSSQKAIKIRINQDRLLAAVLSTKPSITNEQRNVYDNIYQNFGVDSKSGLRKDKKRISAVRTTFA